MKKLVALLLSILMVFSFAACNKEGGSEEGKTDDKVIIGYSLNSMDATMKTMADYFEQEAKARGWEPVLLNANGDTATELTNMESLMNMGAKAVVIMGCDTDGSAAAIDELGKAGVPVIIAGRGINATEYYTYVAGDHHEAGKAQAAYLNGLLDADPALKLNVAFIYGQSGSSSVAQRYEGFEADGINGPHKDRLTLVASQYAEFDTQKAYDITTDMLTTYPEINCFVTQSDEQASGIINAIKAKGEKVEDYIIVSIDCSATGQAYLASGELDATVLMAMKQLAVSSADYVAKALAGESVDKKNQVVGYYQLVTPETYVEVLKQNGMEPAN
ncbi:MAG: sugar ABC transporter substrate-binding protein [Erysipelotrichaceae bacterium]|nr:sugar ABC transporter substrate-binding protein [Erysipelotrichaceae bacterium]